MTEEHWPYQPPNSDVGTAAEVPFDPTQRPPVWVWYVVYCVCMALMYFFVIGVGVMYIVMGMTEFANYPGMQDNPPFTILGVFFIGIGLPFTVIYAIGPFIKGKPAWVIGIINICLGMSSVCCLPACIPLLIFWLKPEVRMYFGFN